MMKLVLEQHAQLDSSIASSLNQQSVGRHAAPLEHIILMLLLLNAACLAKKQQIPILSDFCLSRSGLEPAIYFTGGGNYCITDEVTLLLLGQMIKWYGFNSIIHCIWDYNCFILKICNTPEAYDRVNDSCFISHIYQFVCFCFALKEDLVKIFVIGDIYYQFSFHVMYFLQI